MDAHAHVLRLSNDSVLTLDAYHSPGLRMRKSTCPWWMSMHGRNIDRCMADMVALFLQ